MQRRLFKAFKFIAFIAVLLSLASLLIMTLWNALLPALFGVPLIHFPQALGLLVLSRLLFGGWRGPGFGHGAPWRRHLHARWHDMTPEQRAQFRQAMQQRHCRWRKQAQNVDDAAR